MCVRTSGSGQVAVPTDSCAGASITPSTVPMVSSGTPPPTPAGRSVRLARSSDGVSPRRHSSGALASRRRFAARSVTLATEATSIHDCAAESGVGALAPSWQVSGSGERADQRAPPSCEIRSLRSPSSDVGGTAHCTSPALSLRRPRMGAPPSVALARPTADPKSHIKWSPVGARLRARTVTTAPPRPPPLRAAHAKPLGANERSSGGACAS